MADDQPTIIRRKDAIERGLVRYFTGKPCKRGHVAERFTCNGRCDVCAHEIWHENKSKYIDRDRANGRRYYKNNIERERQQALERYYKDPRAAAERARDYRLRSPKKDECSKKWKSANRHKCAVHDRNRRARERNAPGTHSANDIADILVLQRGRCALCGEKLGKKYHVDHIVPLAKGGSNARNNIQLTHSRCNWRKHARDPMDFMREERGLLL